MSDEFIVKDTPQFDRELPPAGDTLGVCFEVFNLGMQDTTFGAKPQAMIYFEIDVRYTVGDYKGKRMLIGTRPYTASLSARANLRKDLESWRGRSFTDEELKGFNIKKVKGAPAILTIVHNNGYADIAKNGIKRAVTLAPDGKTFIPIKTFELETDPAYVPKRVLNLLEKKLVQENDDTDEVATKGFNKAASAPTREPTKEETEIF